MTDTQLPHALILRTDGSFEVIDWPAENHLPILYAGIGCTYVDAVDISPRLTMWIDDTGLINGALINRAATILYAIHQEPHQHYHGDVIITGGVDAEGETLGLTNDEITSIIEFHLAFTNAEIPMQRTE
ncbi:DUF3846 domain-containing protein [[Kitasatospora] papulosa]|uniref:DUF3846 domain-containing protein n=1 Tax=Streptomyces TaxID=1883 RepID=UPI002259AFFF|nr:DUF3846 domain-containing protein [[Kitasatospora] papulosa]MCX4417790.1 DUF3846 domain-containing protein [[Kitasatospora] papulosa]